MNTGLQPHRTYGYTPKFLSELDELRCTQQLVFCDMGHKVVLKTSENEKSVQKFIAGVKDAKMREECLTLLSLFESTSKMPAKMWGSSIVGFGQYTYYRANGAEGAFMATGFSPRKSGPTIYILPGYVELGFLLKNLGPYKLGKSCLYLKSLEGIDLKVLKKIILFGLAELKKSHKTNY